MKKYIAFIITAALLVAGCVSVPPEHTFSVTPEQLQQRQIETRRFDGISERDILSASSNLLQDVGFNLENSETKLGVLIAQKEREAGSTEQTVVAVAAAILLGTPMITEKSQNIRVALVVRPALGSDGTAIPNSHLVRISFQRWVTRSDNSVIAETLTDPQLYQEFFDKLSSSVFIEAQKI